MATKRKQKICPECKNYRFLIDKERDKAYPCPKCNSKGKYSEKFVWVCLGCGEEEPCRSDCPAGRGKTLVKQ